MFEGLSSYQYHPIQADREIRLFTFTRGKDSRSIHVTIEHHVLDSIPAFQCLSYMWCGPKKKRAVYTGSGKIAITQNLWDALHRFQTDSRFNEKRFWADQICINQSKESREKSEQVMLMSKIFPSAGRVLCWLGKEDGQTREAIQMLEAWSEASTDLRLRDQLARRLQADILRRRGSDEPPGSLEAFFSRAWFGRIWMLQEIYVPREKPPLVVCGALKISWEELVRAFSTLSDSFGGTLVAEALGQGFRPAKDMLLLYCNHRTKRIRLSALLQYTLVREATDKRDLVYGLLGISQQAGFQYPTPDYGDDVTPHDVFARYTRAIIEQEQTLDVLNYNKHSLPRERTWVYDPKLISRQRSLLLDPKQIEACGGCGAGGRTPPLVEEHATNLNLAGLPVDQLNVVVDLDCFIRDLQRSGVEWNMIRNITSRLALKLEVSEDFVTEVLRTLLVNDFWVGFPRSTTTYNNEGEKLYNSLQRSRSNPVVGDQADAVAGAEHHGGVDISPWNSDKLLKLAQQSYRLDVGNTVTGAGCSLRTPDHAVIVKWMEKPIMETFKRRIESNAGDRKLAVTRKGMLALVPSTARSGDDVAVLLGGFYPFVLRKVDSPQKYGLIGPSYVNGLMDGRAVTEYEERLRRHPRANPAEGTTRFCLI